MWNLKLCKNTSKQQKKSALFHVRYQIYFRAELTSFRFLKSARVIVVVKRPLHLGLDRYNTSSGHTSFLLLLHQDISNLRGGRLHAHSVLHRQTATKNGKWGWWWWMDHISPSLQTWQTTHWPFNIGNLHNHMTVTILDQLSHIQQGFHSP